MRPTALVGAALSLTLVEPAFAWIEYASQADHLSIDSPAEPEVRVIGYVTEYSLISPGRVYRYDDGAIRYSMTSMDFAGTPDYVTPLHGDRGHGIVTGQKQWDRTETF